MITYIHKCILLSLVIIGELWHICAYVGGSKRIPDNVQGKYAVYIHAYVLLCVGVQRTKQGYNWNVSLKREDKTEMYSGKAMHIIGG